MALFEFQLAREACTVLLTQSSLCHHSEALCPRIGIMANGRLRCLGSAQHLKNKFGQGYQIDLKVANVDRQDTDFIENAQILLRSSGKSVEPVRADLEEALPPATAEEDDVFFNLEEAVTALCNLTPGDNTLAGLVHPHNPAGFLIWKDATTAPGASLDELAAFATIELRIQRVASFVTEYYPNHVLRERQDTKMRYEIDKHGVRISSIFACIEANKEELRLSDYGVSQTTLEQVFNMHAAEAERLKQGHGDS